MESVIFECECLSFETVRANDLFRLELSKELSDSEFVELSQKYARFLLRSGDMLRATEIVLLDAQKRQWSVDTSILLIGVYMHTGRSSLAKPLLEQILTANSGHPLGTAIFAALTSSDRQSVRAALPKTTTEILHLLNTMLAYHLTAAYRLIRPVVSELNLTDCDAMASDPAGVVALSDRLVSPEGRNLLADALFLSGNQDLALQVLLALPPEKLTLTNLYRQAELLFKRKRFALAREVWLAAVARAPLALGYAGVAASCAAQRDFAGCLAAAKSACNFDPARAEGWGLASLAMLELGMTKLAGVTLNLYLEKLSPQSGYAWLLADLGFAWLEIEPGNSLVCAAHPNLAGSGRALWLRGEALIRRKAVAEGVWDLVAAAETLGRGADRDRVVARALTCCPEEMREDVLKAF